jgi:hypothetical protein
MGLRTRVVTAVAAVVATVAAAVVAAAPPSQAVVNVLNMTVTNNTGRGEQVFLYVLGVNLNTGRLGYVNEGGTFYNWPAGSIPPSPAPDVAITGLGGSGSKTIRIPKALSGRIYMSIGEKLKFFLTPDGLVQPAPWAAGDPNQNILFDWSEFTFNDSGLWLNSSQVDMFAIPHGVTVTGTGGTKKTGEPVAGGRQNVITGVQNQGGDWGRLVYTRGDGTVLRVLAPGKGIGAGLFNSNYYTPYVDSAWDTYRNTTLTVVPFGNDPNTRFSGRTLGDGNLHFTNTGGAEVAVFQRPSTSDVFDCAGRLQAPNDLVVGPISRTLCAALHRSTLGFIHTQPSLNSADFYRQGITNHYSRIIHANMVDGKAYGFPFDDVGGFESLVHDPDPQSAGIILAPFGGGVGPPPPPPPPPPPGGRPVIALNKCMDVRGANPADGTPVQIYDCNNSSAQQWTRVGNTFRAYDKCLDISGNSTANGALVVLWPCHNGGNQEWLLRADESLYNPQSNRCLDIPRADTTNGNQLQIYDCNTTGAQRWRIG